MAKDLGVRPAPTVTVTPVASTNLISVTATSRSATQAAAIANAYATAFAAYLKDQAVTQTNNQIQSLRRELLAIATRLTALQASKDPTKAPHIGYLTSQQVVLTQNLAVAVANQNNVTGGIEVVSSATRPTTASSPKPVRNGFIGLVIGLILGVAVVFGVDQLDDRLISRQGVESVSRHLPVLAVIPVATAWRDPEDTVLVSRTEPTSPSAEAYWSLRSAIQFADPDHPIRTILTTSPAPGEGKTATVANLGVVMAAGGHRTLMVSCDLRRPRLSRFFESDRRPGLTSVLLGEVTLDDAVQPVRGVENLWMLDAGPLPPDPHQVLASAAVTKMFAEFARYFHYVVIDSPPLLAVADSLVLARLADATLVVVAVGRRRKRELRRSLQLLDTVHAPVAGLVLNEVAATSSAYGYAEYHYGYERLDEDETQSTQQSDLPADFALSSHAALSSDPPSPNGGAAANDPAGAKSADG